MELDIDFIVDEVSSFIKEKFVDDIIVNFQTYHTTELLRNYEFETPELTIDIWVEAKNVNDEYVEITNVSFGFANYIYQFNVTNFQEKINCIEDEVNIRLFDYRQNI